ncbi:MAG: dihydrodipicolinate synthase family protein [Pirellulales bacterium]
MIPMHTSRFDPTRLIRRQRVIRGISAVLLPYSTGHQIDWDAFAAHLTRTAACGITPAVNMDTGYVQLINHATRREVLRCARETLGSQEFFAGACVSDREGDAFNLQAYREQFGMIEEVGGVPVVFPSWGLSAGTEKDFISKYKLLAANVDRFIGFELSRVFVPCGRILSIDSYEELLQISNCLGAKHSSLSRQLEWQRLVVRNQIRPEFHVFTGNDLAIDMVRYGSDWLLGLSTAFPEAFAQRDAWWACGDCRFDELDDALQALGDFAFRPPVPAYKHSMAMALLIRGHLGSDETHPESPRRPASDREVIATLVDRIETARHA